MDKTDEPSASRPPPTLRIDRRSLVVLAGLPGAGKSTLLARLGGDPRFSTLDSEQVRAKLRRVLPGWLPYRWYRPLVHLAHRTRIAWWCLTDPKPVIAHEPSTRTTTRAMLLLFGRLTGRRCVLVWLHVDPATALSGQYARGRLIRRRSFQLHVHRAERFHSRLLAEGPPSGWDEAMVFTRDELTGGVRVLVRG
ncbi:AAA family ATPase [Saccharopolyspora erythraea]|uniref:AAA family ATPase n=1 Tax=Saccharopolyspora erythraea TaxID=1836 RepID=UPI001BAD8826|nr:AAA family ATPase [Saccharopolyspora erythraea]QUH04509.1 AAA family ATPase [Saccharopolyspora erythraea]